VATSSTTCPLDCPDACGVTVTTDEHGRFVSLAGNRAHAWSQGTLCGKTALYGDLVTSPERLLTPLLRNAAGALEPASWEAALERIAGRVSGLTGQRILAAWYAGSMGIVAKKFPLRIMHALGATVVDGGLCDNTSTAGYEAVLGPPIGADLEQAEDCDCVILWGCDIARTVQHLQPTVQRLVKRGVPVVVIDVWRTDTLRAVERWGSSGRGLVVEPGSDAALALGLTRLAFERGWVDRDCLATECHGAAEFEAHVRAGYDLDTTSRLTGLDRAAIEELGLLMSRMRRPLFKVGVGWTRRRNGGMGMRAVCSLAAVLGHARAVHYESFGAFALAEHAIERPDLRRGRPPRVVPHVQLGRELQSGRYGAFFVWGHNPAVVCPDAARVRAGMLRADVFSVVHEQFLTETAKLADVVLPATMFPEHADVYRSFGHRRLQWARAACTPPPGPRSNVATFAAIARALGLPRECCDVTPEALCEELLAASSARLAPGDRERLRAGEPVKITPPVPPDGKAWDTPSGKIELLSAACERTERPAMASWLPDDHGETGAFWLVAAPSVHTHNSTFHHGPRHLKRAGKPRCFLHPADLQSVGVAPGAMLTLKNRRGRVSLLADVDAAMPRGRVRVDGLPRAADVPEGVGINALVSCALSDMGDGNVLYSTRVDVLPYRG